MFHLSYLKEKGSTWFNPSYGICGFRDEYNKLHEKLNRSHNHTWNHRNLKRAKEIYAISILAKVMEKQEQTGQWWIQKPKDDPPDGVIGTIIEKNRIRKMYVREVEVVEHIEGTLLDTIRKKLTRKRYEPNTILVCYISQGGIFNLERESKIILNETTSLSHIFLVFPGLKISDIPQDTKGVDFLQKVYKLSSVQIKPVFSFATIDPVEDCKAWRNGEEGNFYIFKGIGRGGSRPVTLENPPTLF